MKQWMVGFLVVFFCFSSASAAETQHLHLAHAKINPADVESLQRGAKIFTNYCAGCHSLKYMRYQRMANDLEIFDKNGELDKALVANTLIFTNAKITDPIRAAMRSKDAAKWMAMAPPDLSLVARVRGLDWLYTYLKSFYVDASRQFGANNLVFKQVAMPNVLQGLQGTQILEEGNKLVITKKGSMSEEEFDRTVLDLVNFLSYVGEPVKVERLRLGIKVLLYLFALLALTYWLKREFWKDVD